MFREIIRNVRSLLFCLEKIFSFDMYSRCLFLFRPFLLILIFHPHTKIYLTSTFRGDSFTGSSSELTL